MWGLRDRRGERTYQAASPSNPNYSADRSAEKVNVHVDGMQLERMTNG